MNYRHIYHAGNFADVFKHTLLLSAADYLVQKEKPCFFLDTHAGLGVYDLTSIEAHKTAEFETGIGAIYTRPDLPAPVRTLVSAVKAMNRQWGALSEDVLAAYPGSPWLLASRLREADRLALVELHPDDYDRLRRTLQSNRQIKCHRQDAYDALISFVPPKEQRGLILIDPPFEVKDEFTRMITALKHALTRFPQGVYAIWYPIKDEAATNAALNQIQPLAKGVFLAAELLIQPANNPQQLNGCGMAFINPPWGLEDTIRQSAPFLAECFGENGAGQWRLQT